ncbi:SusC/RagA family TonB-linked outer membrane protein [Flavihumibacter petaseus]|uniref:Putative TonB-dependent receptor n=1 Tax=Flavihumibacter petaseus NBRC 106054 TaxID=1220578 RepID=A0A0E9MYV0_9BACT|nr:TonB-dependent receptor [Flavihumibacter petaseus]GAO42708.1 putative TonB-dependent receptor [Flavihumibacter petaseus NBRC 106054]
MKLKLILWALLCLCGTVSVSGQELRKEVSGRILDSLGVPLSKASVTNLKSGTKVLSGNEGQFTIAVQAGETIEVSFVGYRTTRLADFTGGDIALKQELSSLEDVVVVGFATQKKKDLTGAIDHISGAKLAERPIANVFQGLQGVSPGLNITYNGGQPGSTPQLNIRGFASINDNNGSPLIIIDGIAATTDDLLRINAADISSISVLRDASSAAIYGARAAFGVILLTTKQGGKQRQSMSYNNYFAWSKRTVLPDPVTDPYIYMKVLETSTNNTPWDYVNYESWQYDWAKQRSDDPSSAPESMVNPNDPTKWAYMGNSNLNDYFFNKSSFSQYHTLSFSGAASTASKRPISYLLSADYTNENGLIAIARDDWKRYGLRGKLDFSPLSWLKISNNLNVYQLERNQPTYNVTDVYYTQPTDVVKNPDGTWGNNTAGFLASKLVDGGRNVQTRFGFQNILRGVATFLNGDLQVTADASFKRELWNYSTQYLPYNIGYGPNDVRAEGGTSSVAETNATVKQYVYDFYANYNKQLGDHAIKVTAGYNQEEYEWDPVYVSRANLISSSVPYIGLATGDMQVNTTAYEGYYSYAIRSLFGRINYAYKGRYILEANGRMDGSSRFPSTDRWGFFPSVSGAWIVSEENFWRPISPVISSLKVRASHGWLGNQSVAYYGYIQSLAVSQSSYLIDGTRPNVLGTAPSLQVDPNNYTWEKVGTSNIGFDLGVLDNKITAGFDYFVRNTTGMLAPSQELPAVLGTTAPRQNAADLQTKGWELSVAYTNTFRVASKPLTLNVKAILSDSKSKITKYDNQSKTFSAAFYEGQTLGEVWGLTNDGLFKNQDEINALDESAIVPWGALEIVPGWPKYVDYNKDNKIELGTSAMEPKDLKIIGNTSPRYRVGFNLNASWSNFDFSLFLQGVLKQDFYPHHYLYWGPYQQPYANVYPWNLDFYRGTAESDDERAHNSKSYNDAGLADANTNAHFPVMQAWLADNNYGSGLDIPQTQYMLNAAYLRVKNLTVGYSLPEGLTRKMHVNRLRFFFSGENLYEFSSIKQYLDPESVSDGYGWEYPYQRKFSFGINLDF